VFLEDFDTRRDAVFQMAEKAGGFNEYDSDYIFEEESRKRQNIQKTNKAHAEL
jgi:hypothetical protein